MATHALPTIRPLSSRIRDAAPIYSIRQFLWNAGLLGGAYALARWLEPYAALAMTLGACGGAFVVQYLTRPAGMAVTPSQATAIEAVLRRSNYTHSPDEGWRPPLPAWLRWTHNRVLLRPCGYGVNVEGPVHILRSLRRSLRALP